MKKTARILLAACVCLLLFCACSNASKIVGAWEGDGTFSSLEGTPITAVRRLMFLKDGTGYAIADEGQKNFTYSLTDDTLSLQFGEMGMGIVYELDGDTLTIRRDAVFTRVR